uniref:Doublecortin domain-containing protein n=1 Tax=Ascaris lumbricoides TaxID=6252 RepID=A0A0M3HMX0_ASCLU
MLQSSSRSSTMEASTNRSTTLLPNLPAPVNGRIKIYDCSHRTFTRPYSAKTVFFYKEGDNYFTGVRVPVSKARYRNMDSLLDDLNSNIHMPFGVRRLTTPLGRTPIESIDQLQHLGSSVPFTVLYHRYIASSTKAARPLNFAAIEQIHRAREEQHQQMRRDRTGGTSFWASAVFTRSGLPTSPSFNAKLRMTRSLGLSFLPATAKQMLFVLNGKPSRIYRALLNPMRMKTFDALLEEVSQGLQIAIFKIYTYAGRRVLSVDELMSMNEARVLAVPRHERPHLKRHTAVPRATSLPPIPQEKVSKSTSATTSSRKLSSANGKKSPPNRNVSTYNHNSIDRPHLIRSTKRMQLTRQTACTKKEATLLPAHSTKRKQREEANLSATFVIDSPKVLSRSRRDDDDSGRPRSPEEADLKVLKNCENENEDAGQMRDDSLSKKSVDWKGEPALSQEDDQLSRQRVDSKKEQENEYNVHDGETKRTTTSRQQGDGSDGTLEAQCADESHEVVAESKHEASPRDGTDDIDEGIESVDNSIDDESQRNRAATTIQAYFRGYRVRQQLQRAKEVSCQEEASVSAEPDDEKDVREEAAIVIQAAWRGYAVRKKFGPMKESRKIIESPSAQHSAIDEEDGSNKSEQAVAAESQDESNTEMEQDSDKDNKITYTVSVITGNRWAADSDKDLYIILYGDIDKSSKCALRQDYISWLQTNEPKFRQNRMDSFHIETTELGTLQKIVIGHEFVGYGAGIFIERVLVTENIADGRQFLFQCSKWLDSGQVDGKIERMIKTTAFYYISSIPEDNTSSSDYQGRWELILHTGKKDGTGGTTSNLNIVGYGTQGSSITTKIYDNKFATAPSTSLVQVDFGDIGDLLKIRIEVDGSGVSPDYFLNKVELRDLDTEERMVCFVGKWLRWKGNEKHVQPYREFPVFRAAFEPLNIITYEGKMRLASLDRRHLLEEDGHLQIFGEIGETGRFPVSLQFKPDRKTEIGFKTEAASIGRIHCVRLFVTSNEIGEQLYEGLCVLQAIYDRRGVVGVNVASNWLVDRVLIRESPHAPYRFVLKHSRVKEVEEDGELFKEIVLSEMEGLPTKVGKKKARKREKPQYILSMVIADHSTLIPNVTLCGEQVSAQMSIIDKAPHSEQDVGLILKLRIEVDSAQKLLHVPAEESVHADEGVLEIRRMCLTDTANGDELRFANVNAVFTSSSIREFAAVWPDIPPLAVVRYQLTIASGECVGNFEVLIKMKGSRGDTGLRKLVNNDTPQFQPNTITFTLCDVATLKPPAIFQNSIFDIEAVTIGDPQTVELVLQSDEDNFVWKCEQLHVLDGETSLYYIFRFEKYAVIDDSTCFYACIAIKQTERLSFAADERCSS